MWRPGFEFEEQRPARLYGYHRAFCIYSHVHRGTPEQPGLVFGLDAGGSCRGIAFRVDGARAEDTRRYLFAREQVTSVYLDVIKPVELLDEGRRVDALCFIVDRQHAQYAGALPFERQVELIVKGKGSSGENPEYLESMVRHLEQAGIADKELVDLWQAVRARL